MYAFEVIKNTPPHWGTEDSTAYLHFNSPNFSSTALNVVP